MLRFRSALLGATALCAGASLLDDLRGAVEDPARVSDSMVVRAPFGRDANSHHAGDPPRLVVRPASTEEVSRVLALCRERHVPVVAYGSGTSLEGHTATTRESVTLDLGVHMGGIKRLSVEDMDVTVGAGMTWGELNEELKPHGLFFPMDPGPGASIGGMVGTSCSGTNAVRYGTMGENVLSLEVVLADGTVLHTGQRARKSSAGYDLTRLFVGSEGTLGVVTEATLKLQHLPERTAVAVVQFDSIEQATLAVQDVTQRGIQIGCVELLDSLMVKAVNAYSDLSYPEKPTILFKFAGAAPVVEYNIEETRSVCAARGGGEFQWADGEEAREELWHARKVCLWAAQAMRPGSVVWTTDVCVPISKLSFCIQATQEIIAESELGMMAPIVGHVGDGNFHVFFLIDPSSPAELAEAKRLNHLMHLMVRHAISLDGTCTGEHGVGVGKRDYLNDELGHEAVELMRVIKAAVDPDNVLNPGKVLPPPDHHIDDVQQRIASGDRVLVRYTAPWCGPCQYMTPAYNDLMREYTDVDGTHVMTVNCDHPDSQCKRDHGVRYYPTIRLHRDGKAVGEHDGERTTEHLRAFLESVPPPENQ